MYTILVYKINDKVWCICALNSVLQSGTGFNYSTVMENKTKAITEKKKTQCSFVSKINNSYIL